MRRKIAVVVCAGFLLGSVAWAQDGSGREVWPAVSWGGWVNRAAVWLQGVWSNEADGPEVLREAARVEEPAGEPAASDGETCGPTDPLRQSCAADPNG